MGLPWFRGPGTVVTEHSPAVFLRRGACPVDAVGVVVCVWHVRRLRGIHRGLFQSPVHDLLGRADTFPMPITELRC